MKNSTLFLLSCLLTLAVQAQTPAPKPGPEHKKLEVWVGKWTYEVSNQPSPFWPAGKYAGETISQMVLGGFFLESRWGDKSSDSGALYQGIALEGYDPLTKTYLGHSFENDGNAISYSRTVSGNTWTTTGTRTDSKGKVYKTRSMWTFSSGGRTITGAGEYSLDEGKTWLPLYKETDKRVGN